MSGEDYFDIANSYFNEADSPDDSEVEEPKKTWAQMSPEERKASIDAFNASQDELTRQQEDVKSAARWEGGLKGGLESLFSNAGRAVATVPYVGLPAAVYLSAQGSRVGEAAGSELAKLTGLGVAKDENGQPIYEPEGFAETFKGGERDLSIANPGLDRTLVATLGEGLSRLLSPVKGATKEELKAFAQTLPRKAGTKATVDTAADVDTALGALAQIEDRQAAARGMLGIDESTRKGEKPAAKWATPTREGRFVPESDEFIPAPKDAAEEAQRLLSAPDAVDEARLLDVGDVEAGQGFSMEGAQKPGGGRTGHYSDFQFKPDGARTTVMPGAGPEGFGPVNTKAAGNMAPDGTHYINRAGTRTKIAHNPQGFVMSEGEEAATGMADDVIGAPQAEPQADLFPEGDVAPQATGRFQTSAPPPLPNSDKVIGDRVMEIIAQPRYRAAKSIQEGAQLVVEDIPKVKEAKYGLLQTIDEASQGVPFGDIGVPVTTDSKAFLQRLFSEEMQGAFDANLPGVATLYKVMRGAKNLSATEIGEAVDSINVLRKQTGAFARQAGTIGAEVGSVENALNQGFSKVQSELINRIDQAAATHSMPVSFGQIQDTLSALYVIRDSFEHSLKGMQGRTAKNITENLANTIDNRSLIGKAKDALFGGAKLQTPVDENAIRKGALNTLLSADDIAPNYAQRYAREAAMGGQSMLSNGEPEVEGQPQQMAAQPNPDDPFGFINMPDDEPQNPQAADMTGADTVQPEVGATEKPSSLFVQPAEAEELGEPKEKLPPSVNGFLEKKLDISTLGFDPKTAEQVKVLLTGDKTQQREGLYMLKKERPELFEPTQIPGVESMIDGVVVDPDEQKKVEIKAAELFKGDLKRKAQLIGAIRKGEPIPSWSYKHLGGEEQMDYVDTFLEGQEGGLKTEGYWGGNDKSGVTIGAGVDLGQWSLSDLQKVGVPNSILTQVYPYVGARGKRVEKGLAKVPLKMKEEDARELTQKVKQSIKNEVGEKYRQASGVPIDQLPIQAQAVIYSLGYNYGTKLDTKQPKLFAALSEGNWGLAAKLLGKIKSNPELKQRRLKEASILAEITAVQEDETYDPSGDVKGKVQIAKNQEMQDYSF